MMRMMKFLVSFMALKFVTKVFAALDRKIVVIPIFNPRRFA